MSSIIIYGSRYGCAEFYASELSRLTGITAYDYHGSPRLDGVNTAVYVGSVYAGSVTGLSRSFRRFAPPHDFKLIVAAVGLCDPCDAEVRSSIQSSVKRQLPKPVFERTKLFLLRGRIDFGSLKASHRLLISALSRMMKNVEKDKLTPQDKMILEICEKTLDYTDVSSLRPICRELERS